MKKLADHLFKTSTKRFGIGIPKSIRSLIVFISIITLSTISTSDVYGQCGSCVAPSCVVSTVANFTAGESKHANWPIDKNSFCEEYFPQIAGPATTESYHTVTIGTSGLLGAVVSAYAGGGLGCVVGRTYELFPNGATCTVGNNIAPVGNNVNGSAYENPEWNGLTPGGTYTMKVTYNIPGGCDLADHCQVYYSPDTLVTGSCPADVGTGVVRIESVDVTDPSNEYDVCLNQTIVLSQTSPTFQSSADPVYGYAILTCAPTAANPVNDACYLGNDLNASTTLNSGGISGNTYYVVPLTYDEVLEEDPDFDGDGCYGIGAAIRVNFLTTTCAPPTGGCDCTTPNCAIGSVPTYADRFPPIGAQTCVTGLTESGTYTSYQTVTTDGNGFVGAYVQAMTMVGPASATISSMLYTTGSCGSSPITADGPNINNRSSTNGSWNPEWSGLTPNTNYILMTTFNITSAGGFMSQYCMDYYGTNVAPPSPSCDCAAPSCASDLITNPSAPTFTACDNWGYYANDTTVTNYYTIPSSSSGTLGFLQQVGALVTCTSGEQSAILTGRTYELFATGDCDGTAITATTANAGFSSSLNPEWTGLTASTNYILKVTTTIPASTCGVQSTCLDYYYPTVSGGCDCNTPNCTIGSVPTYADRFPPVGAQSCVTGLNESGTYTSYQIVTTDANGFVGAYVQAMTMVGPASATISAQLYTTGSCGSSPITADGTNINNRSSTNGSWNPEWSGLTPNTNYILVTTFNITSAGGYMSQYCMDYYGTTAPTCPADAGTVVSSTTGDATTPTANEHILCPNAQVNITSSGFTLPSNDPMFANASMGYTLYTCQPPANPDPFNDACAVLIGGAPIVIESGASTSDINDGSTVTNFPGATDQTYWVVPITLKAGSPDLLIDASCYATGTPVQITYLNDITTSDSVDCIQGTVTVTVSGGYPEFFSGSYTIVNQGAGTLSSATISANGGSVVISGLQDAENYSLEITDDNGCTSTFAGGTFVYCGCTDPTIVANLDSTTLCAGSSLTLTATGADSTYTWNPSSVESGTAFTPSQTGTYIVAGYDTGGCVGYDTVYVVVEDVIADFSVNATSGETPFELITTNSSTGATTYEWTFGEGTTSTEFEPTFTYDNEGNFDLQLVAQNDNGCVDTSQVQIIEVIDGCALEVFSAFTPDDNGQNDTWAITCFENQDGAEVQVYNRWGTKVYESVGGSSYIPWTGKNENGDVLPMGSYFYVITLLDQDPMNGSITLIK